MQIGAGLERLHRVAHGIVVKLVVLVAGYVETLTQRDHALVLLAWM